VNGSEQKARRTARLEWLRGHVELPGATGDITADQRAALETARLELVRTGLYSVGEQPKIVRWGMRLLVSELRGELPLTAARRAAQRYRS